MKIAAIAIVLMLGFGCNKTPEFFINDNVVVTNGFFRGMEGIVKDKDRVDWIFGRMYLVQGEDFKAWMDGSDLQIKNKDMYIY